MIYTTNISQEETVKPKFGFEKKVTKQSTKTKINNSVSGKFYINIQLKLQRKLQKILPKENAVGKLDATKFETLFRWSHPPTHTHNSFAEILIP